MCKRPDSNGVSSRQAHVASRRASAIVGRLVLAAVCAGAVAVTARNSLGQPRGAENPRIRVGQEAPDFELPKLTITNDADGKPIGVIRKTDTIRLSSFRGKRPVCLIMSSYT